MLKFTFDKPLFDVNIKIPNVAGYTLFLKIIKIKENCPMNLSFIQKILKDIPVIFSISNTSKILGLGLQFISTKL